MQYNKCNAMGTQFSANCCGSSMEQAAILSFHSVRQQLFRVWVYIYAFRMFQNILTLSLAVHWKKRWTQQSFCLHLHRAPGTDWLSVYLRTMQIFSHFVLFILALITFTRVQLGDEKLREREYLSGLDWKSGSKKHSEYAQFKNRRQRFFIMFRLFRWCEWFG